MARQEEIKLEHIESFMRGEERGFHHIYATYRQRVLTYCVYYLGNETLAKDAFQEVFIKVYTHREQLREPKALVGWLLTITRNVCLNMLRSAKLKREHISIDEREPDDPELQQLAAHPNMQELDEDDLRIALSQLPLMYREAFILREFEGYEYSEIAALMGTSVPNVQVRVTRAKMMLRKLLMPEEAIVREERAREEKRSLKRLLKKPAQDLSNEINHVSQATTESDSL